MCSTGGSSNALRVAQDAWDLDTTGDVDEKTFKRMLKALRDRGERNPEESAGTGLVDRTLREMLKK